MKTQLRKRNQHDVVPVTATPIQAKSLTAIRPMDTAPPAVQARQTADVNQQAQEPQGFNLAEIPIFAPETGRSAPRVQMKLDGALQRKLTVGAPGDKYEQEADRVAEKVVQQINTPATEKATSSQGVQKQGEEEEVQAKPEISAIQREGEEEEVQAKPEISTIQREGEEEEVQAKPEISTIQREGEEEEVQAKPDISTIQREGEEEEVQAKPQNKSLGGGEVSTDIETTIQSAKSGGQPLDAGLQRQIGKAMGADFSGVKVHTDSQADKLNRSLSSRAFATGPNLFFKQGEYNPGSRGGQELIAHELTHVVQQGGRQKIQKIQRVLDFDVNAELPKVSLRAKLKGWTSVFKSTLSQIRRNVKQLQAEEARRFKLRESAVRDLQGKEEYVDHLGLRHYYLRQLSQLCNEWLGKHGNSDDERIQERADDIKILRGKVITELAEVGVELEQSKSEINVLNAMYKEQANNSMEGKVDSNEDEEESENPQTTGKYGSQITPFKTKKRFFGLFGKQKIIGT